MPLMNAPCIRKAGVLEQIFELTRGVAWVDERAPARGKNQTGLVSIHSSRSSKELLLSPMIF